MERVDQTRSVAAGILEELNDSCSLYEREYSRFCSRECQELDVPVEDWIAAESTTPLGTRLGYIRDSNLICTAIQ